MGKLYYNTARIIARFIFPKRTTIYHDQQPPTDEPIIYVSNHSGILGPAVTELYLDRPKCIWMTDVMTNKETCNNYYFHDFEFGRSKKNKKMCRFKSSIMPKLLRPLFTKNDRIILVHKKGIAIKKTFDESLALLATGTNIVIYPERHERYKKYVHQFNIGFVDLAKLYYRKTGKCLQFYPMYVGNQLKTIDVGTPITYDPTNDSAVERTRVADYLRDSINDIGASLPKHTVIPYVPQIFYDYYGEFEKDEAAYWAFADQKYSE